MVAITIFGLFLLLMVLGVPVVLSLAIGTLAAIAQIALANSLVGHMRAGLAQVNVISSLFFGGVTGSAIADVAGIGNLVIKQMENRGYPTPFAAALPVASSVIGPTMWPSVPLLMIYNRMVAHRFKVPLTPRPPLRQIAGKFGRSGWALLAPLIIIGSVLSGVASPVEAGVIACAYTLVLGVAYRSLSCARIRHAVSETVMLFGSVLLVIGVSAAMSWVLTYDQVPQRPAESVISLTDNKYLFLLIVVLFFLVIDTVLENIPAMVILIPIMMPLVDHFGIDRVHFGLIMVYGLLIGIVSPPDGVSLFIVTKIADITFERVCTAILPFLLPLIAVRFIITYGRQSGQCAGRDDRGRLSAAHPPVWHHARYRRGGALSRRQCLHPRI